MSTIEFIKYAKKFFIALAAALAILGVAVADDVVTSSEWVQVAIAFVSALGVYTLPNEEVE